jgi:hypothetical protein
LAYPNFSSEQRDEMARHQFLEGLMDRELVIWVHHQKTTTLQDTVTSAVEGELYLKGFPPAAAEQRNIRITKVEKETNGYQNELQQMRTQLEQLMKLVGKESPAVSEPAIILICEYCKRRGHSVQSCWKKLGVCYRCGSAQHNLTHCPKMGPRQPPRVSRSQQSENANRQDEQTASLATVSEGLTKLTIPALSQ